MSINGIEARFTTEEIDLFAAMLLERRRERMVDFQKLEEAGQRDAPNVSALSRDPADLGSDSASSDVSLGRRASESLEIQEIDEALERIREGSFGACESCGRPVGKPRLEAIPYARLCLPCKILEER